MVKEEEYEILIKVQNVYQYKIKALNEGEARAKVLRARQKLDAGDLVDQEELAWEVSTIKGHLNDENPLRRRSQENHS